MKMASARIGLVATIGLALGGCDLYNSSAPGTQSDKEFDSAPLINPCAGLEVREGAIAASPRANENIERLALRLSSGITADQAVYDRLMRDRLLLAGMWPDLGALFTYLPKYQSELLVDASPATSDAMIAGSYTAWSCLNQALGATINRRYSGGVILSFRPVLNLEKVAPLYRALPSVRGAGPNGRVGDGSNVYVTPSDDVWHYVFDVADGDCPSGCINHQLSYYNTNLTGSAWWVGSGRYAAGGSNPPWMDTYFQNATSR